MTKQEKLLTKFNNLRGEASFSEAKKVMEMMGVLYCQDKRKSPHI